MRNIRYSGALVTKKHKIVCSDRCHTFIELRGTKEIMTDYC